MLEYKTKEQKVKFYNSPAWTGNNGIRHQALKRDNYECQRCKGNGRVHVDSIKVNGERKNVELNVHHVKDVDNFPELALELDNVMTVCVSCHNEIHGKGFKQTKPKWPDEKW